MKRVLRSAMLAGVVAVSGLFGPATSPARAQWYGVGGRGVSVNIGVGNPYGNPYAYPGYSPGGFGGYSVTTVQTYPAYVPPLAPVVVAPAPWGLPAPYVYRPRPYYRPYGFGYGPGWYPRGYGW